MNLVRLFFICTCLTWYFLNCSNIFSVQNLELWSMWLKSPFLSAVATVYPSSPQLPRPAKATRTKSYFYIVRNKTPGHCPSFSGGWILKAGLPWCFWRKPETWLLEHPGCVFWAIRVLRKYDLKGLCYPYKPPCSAIPVMALREAKTGGPWVQGLQRRLCLHKTNHQIIQIVSEGLALCLPEYSIRVVACI